MGRVVGIDLGTTFSLIAYHGCADGRAEVYSGAVRLAAVPVGCERGPGRKNFCRRAGARDAC